MCLWNLANEVLKDIFTYYNRKQLCMLELISSPIYQLINTHFGNSKPPFIVLKQITVKANNEVVNIYWIGPKRKQRRLNFATFKAALPWLSPPFIRAKLTSIYGYPQNNSSFSTTIQCFLDKIKHCWQNGWLDLHQQRKQIGNEFENASRTIDVEWTMTDTKTFTETINQCSNLSIFWQTIPIGCPTTEILDIFQSIKIQLPTFSSNFDKLMEWLELPRLGSLAGILPSKSVAQRHLTIYTLECEYSKLEPVLKAIKNRFLLTKSIPALPALIEFTHVRLLGSIPAEMQIFEEFNEKTNEQMRCIRLDVSNYAIQIQRQLKEKFNKNLEKLILNQIYNTFQFK